MRTRDLGKYTGLDSGEIIDTSYIVAGATVY